MTLAYIKKVNNKLKENGASEETIKQFQSGAAGAMKKILANYDNYDVLMGSSMDGSAMYVDPAFIRNRLHIWDVSLTLLSNRHVLIDFREDGVTPYATLWKHGLTEYKV